MLLASFVDFANQKWYLVLMKIYIQLLKTFKSNTTIVYGCMMPAFLFKRYKSLEWSGLQKSSIFYKDM